MQVCVCVCVGGASSDDLGGHFVIFCHRQSPCIGLMTSARLRLLVGEASLLLRF